MFKFKLVVLIIILALGSTIASASLRSSNAPFVENIAAGGTLSHDVKIDIPNETQAMDFETTIFGFGQDLNGGPVQIPANQDNSSFSAIKLINVTPSSFRIEPNQSQIVTIKATMPNNAEAGTKYALVNIRGLPKKGTGTVNVALAINSRVQLTVTGSDLIRTGNITSIVLNPDGSAIVTLKNTGNTDYKALAEGELKDSKGTILANTSSSLTNDIIPPYSRKFGLTFEPKGKLDPGKYTINATVKLGDGTVIASKEESLDIK